MGTDENKKPINFGIQIGNNQTPNKSISLRDHFAGLAMQSMIQNPPAGHWDCGSGLDIDYITEWAYKYADAMLKQREL